MSSEGVVLYTSGVSASVFIAKQSSRIESWLGAYKIPYTKIDISINEDAKNVRMHFVFVYT